MCLSRPYMVFDSQIGVEEPIYRIARGRGPQKKVNTPLVKGHSLQVVALMMIRYVFRQEQPKARTQPNIAILEIILPAQKRASSPFLV